MTGESIPTKKNWLRLKPYYLKLVSLCLVTSGAVLIIEHIITFGGVDLFDWIGHCHYGLAMVIVGFLLSIKWGQWKELKLWIFKNQIR